MLYNITSDCEKLVKDMLGEYPGSVRPMKISGSERRYFRCQVKGDSYVMCISENRKENQTFIALSTYLRGRGIRVPEIFGIAENYGAYILQDLGDTDLLTLLKEKDDHCWKVITQSISQLVKFQTLPRHEWEDIVEFPPFDADLVRFDFEYVMNNLVRPSGANFDEKAIYTDFEKLEKRLLNYPQENWGLMYRDFQSRNIMIDEGPYFIDYQSARLGPGIYDLVSFAWQAKAQFSPADRERIVRLYTDLCMEQGKDMRETVADNIDYWAAFRILQTLGAYGRRGLKEGKPHFKESIPLALANLNSLMESGPLSNELPNLASLMGRMHNFL